MKRPTEFESHFFHTFVAPFVVYDAKWVPRSSRFVLCGMDERSGKGKIQVGKLNGVDSSLLSSFSTSSPIKCGTFALSSADERFLGTGDFAGNVALWDLNAGAAPVSIARAHKSLVNGIDGCGGLEGKGTWEVASAGRDGCVHVFDRRDFTSPVMTFSSGGDAWCLSFGNSVSDSDRFLAAGFEDGSVRIFDMRMGVVFSELSFENGIVDVQFHDKAASHGRLVASTTKGEIHITDTSRRIGGKEFAHGGVRESHGETIWCIRHHRNPQFFATTAGNGSLRFYEHILGKEGSFAKARILHKAAAGHQPLVAFDWNSDFGDVFILASLDRQCHLGIVSPLDKG